MIVKMSKAFVRFRKQRYDSLDDNYSDNEPISECDQYYQDDLLDMREHTFDNFLRKLRLAGVVLTFRKFVWPSIKRLRKRRRHCSSDTITDDSIYHDNLHLLVDF